MKNIDVYDFDKTIYKKDSSLEFFKFVLKFKPLNIRYIPKFVCYYILNKFNFIKKEKLKEYFFKFLKNIDVDKLVLLFWEKEEKNINYDLFRESRNSKIVISASPNFLLKPICDKLNIDKLIASNVDKKTGKFLSKNCKGEEKVKRLNKEFKNFKIINFYSDSYSDNPLASISKNSYMVKKGKIYSWPNNNLKKEAFLYLIVGGLTMLITLLSYYLLTLIFNPQNKFLLQSANFISWFLAVVFAYICNRKYVFNIKKNSFNMFFKFLISRIFTLLLDMLGMHILVFSFFINHKVSKIIVQVLVVIINYLVSKFLIFNGDVNV